MEWAEFLAPPLAVLCTWSKHNFKRNRMVPTRLVSNTATKVRWKLSKEFCKKVESKVFGGDGREFLSEHRLDRRRNFQLFPKPKIFWFNTNFLPIRFSTPLWALQWCRDFLQRSQWRRLTQLRLECSTKVSENPKRTLNYNFAC